MNKLLTVPILATALLCPPAMAEEPDGDAALQDEVRELRQQVEQQQTTIDFLLEDRQAPAADANSTSDTPLHATGIELAASGDKLHHAEGLAINLPQSATSVVVSGFIRASANHDFDAIASPTKFNPSFIVVDGQPPGEPDSRTTFFVNASRLVVTSSTQTAEHQISTYLSADFMGNTTSADADFELRQAWIEISNIWDGQLQLGQGWTTWDAITVLPETMDFEGPNGSQQIRQGLIRWTRNLQESVDLVVALEQPDYVVTNGTTESAWPDTIAALEWHSNGALIRPAVLVRDIRSEDTNGVSDAALGWGAQLAGRMQIPTGNGRDNVRIEVVYGAGIGSYNDDGNLDDAIFNAGGELKTIQSFQGYAAFQHYWTAATRSSFVYGWVDVDNRPEQSADALHKTTYVAANLVWTPLAKFDVGIEYLYGERVNFDENSGSANRVQATAQYTF